MAGLLRYGVLFNWRLTKMKSLKSRLHHTTSCQTGCQRYGNRLYRVYKHSTGCTTRFDNRLNEPWLFVQHGWQPVGCLFTRYSRLSYRLYNRFDNRLYRVNGGIIIIIVIIIIIYLFSNLFSNSTTEHDRDANHEPVLQGSTSANSGR